MGLSQSKSNQDNSERQKKDTSFLAMSDHSSDKSSNNSTIKPEDFAVTEKSESNKKNPISTEHHLPENTSDTIKEADLLSSAQQIGGNLDLKKISDKNRYSKYNIFNEIRKAETDFLGGFNSQTHSEEEQEENSNNSKTVKHIRNIIMNELDNLNKETINQLGGGCDCDKEEEEEKEQIGGTLFISSSTSTAASSTSTDYSSSDSSGYSRKKSKKSKKINKQSGKQSRTKNSKKTKKDKRNYLGPSDDEYEGNLVINSENELDTSNNSNTEEGLSIFPFNSSDVKSSVSEKHNKILRRKL